MITSLTISSLLGSITVAFACGLFIAYLYKFTYKGTSYSTSYVQALVAFTMITTIVIMVIGNNLARAFGLVGSMSIVRFRMAIKDTQDIVFIFFALAIGMATGVGQHMVAVSSTLYIGMIMAILSHSHFASPHKREYLLQFNFISTDPEYSPYIPILNKYCRKHKIVNIKSIDDHDIIELSYYVTMKNIQKSKEFISQINAINGVSNLNVFFDEE